MKPFDFLISFIAILFLSCSLSAQTNIYQVYSLDDQFVLYSEDPSAAQQGALVVEQVRTDLFEQLGWLSYSQYPTQIWLLKKSEESQFKSSLQWQSGEWLKKLEIPIQAQLQEEVLPRRVIELALKEFSLGGKPNEKPNSIVIPLWLVEGFRQNLNEGKSTDFSSTLFLSIKEMFYQKELFANQVAKEQYAKLAGSFLTYLMNLPNGQKKIKEYVRLLAQSNHSEKLFFQVYQDDFSSFQQLQFAWNKKWHEQKTFEANQPEPKKDRQQVILKYLDALESD